MDILEKAYRSAQILSALRHKGYSAWMVEKRTIQRVVLGKDPLMKISPVKAGIEEEVSVASYPFGVIRYEAEDAYAIAQSINTKIAD